MRSADRVLQLVGLYISARKQSRVQERPLLAVPKIPSELELQARWFAGDFGRNFKTTLGEDVDVVQFGFWNRESGPDFQDAAVRIGDNATLRGAIELDLLDRNWELHGHANNPEFENTVLHIFLEQSSARFFTRTRSHRNVPQVKLDLSRLSDASAGVLPIVHPGRCIGPLKNLDGPRVLEILDAAAQFRLQLKAERLGRHVEVHGPEEALFQATADALGYKQNRLPFTILAQRLPLASLRKRIDDSEALLFGVAGFLDAPGIASFRASTRTYVRALWDNWWKYRDQFARLVLPPRIWRTSGARPTNHPHRRLGALASLLSHWKRFSTLASVGSATELMDFFNRLQHEFWNQHYTLAADRAPAPIALIGASRAAEILANVIYPLRVRNGQDVWGDYRNLPAQLSNQSVRIAAARLFGDDQRQRRLLRTVSGQQGLLQIYEDFCMRDASDCADCPFPEQVRNWAHGTCAR